MEQTTYKQFRDTFKAALNRWPDMSYLFGYIDKEDVIGTCEIQHYEKTASGWKKDGEATEEEYTTKRYLCAFDPGWAVWAKSERNFTTYTKYGKIPYKNSSISPDGQKKVVRVMHFR